VKINRRQERAPAAFSTERINALNRFNSLEPGFSGALKQGNSAYVHAILEMIRENGKIEDCLAERGIRKPH
jgi:hypothetical protein